jgi:hypothetical protein
MNIHKSQLFWGSLGVQGFDPLPNDSFFVSKTGIQQPGEVQLGPLQRPGPAAAALDDAVGSAEEAERGAGHFPLCLRDCVPLNPLVKFLIFPIKIDFFGGYTGYTMNLALIEHITHDGSMVLLYMVTWIPSIYPIHVSIYTNTMDPMGYYGWLRNPAPDGNDGIPMKHCFYNGFF